MNKKIDGIVKKVKARTVYLPTFLYKMLPNKLQPVEAKTHSVMKELSQDVEGFVAVQIGANDGVSGDPVHGFIRKYAEKAVFVEPVKEAFDRLKQNYADKPHFVFENVAIAEKNGQKDFYVFKEQCNDRLGSLNPEVQAKRLYKGELTRTRVNCIKFSELCARNDITKIDLLHLDTEGYDAEIIKTIDFNKIKIRMLMFENKHLQKSELKHVESILITHNFAVISNGNDTFCWNLELYNERFKGLIKIPQTAL